MNINGKQIIAVVMAVLGVLMVAKSQLTPMFGAETADYVINAAGLLNLMLGSIMAAISGNQTQDAQVRQVLDMTGVKRLEVNKDASPALALLAVNPDVDKIAPAPEAVRAVEATATAATKAA